MRIIWAMDAFEDNKELNEKMAVSLTHLFERTHAEIEPLYLFRENEIVLPTNEFPTGVTDHSRTAESLFREVLEDYDCPSCKSPTSFPTLHNRTQGPQRSYLIMPYEPRLI